MKKYDKEYTVSLILTNSIIIRWESTFICDNFLFLSHELLNRFLPELYLFPFIITDKINYFPCACL